MSTVESPPSMPAELPWLGPPMAADILQRACSVLGGQPWPADGELCWFGWGGPSAELISSMPGRWVKTPTGASDGTESTRVDSTTAAGVHAMVDRLAVDRIERLDWFARLWRGVVPDGLMALTYPVHAGPLAPETRSAETKGIPVDHQGLVEELLTATSGRVLTADLVVHHPPSIAEGITWATLVLRRLR